MTEIRKHPLKSLPVANYRSAIAAAVEWLGDRYLLAKPINSARSGVDHSPLASNLKPRGAALSDEVGSHASREFVRC